jgi:HlyD family secretion protein
MGTVIVVGVGGTLALWTFTGDQTSKHLVASLQGLLQPESLPEGFTSGNGRIEATELDVATKLAGRVEAVLAQEGDTVAADQVLVRLDTETLEAQLRQARAELRRAREDREYALAIVAQRESEREFAQNDLRRVLELAQTKHVSEEQVDQTRTQSRTAEAALRAAQIKVAETEAAIAAAEAQVDRIQADIDDCELRAPRRGRVLYRLVEPGEVLGIGGKALTLLDLTDVYMVLFLPETVAGRVPIGAAVRIVLDAAPEYVIPARISFVAARAQFTPKQVETRSEREKLVFRAKARIDPQLLRAKEPFVKTGVPGVAYVQLRSTAEWPPWLAVRLP